MNDNKFKWSIEELPFIYKELDTPCNEVSIPNSLPLDLIVDEQNGVLTQQKNETIEKALETAYMSGSVMAGVMDEDSEDIGYTSDFISFIKSTLSNKKLEGIKVLEIGCGTGFLLAEIQKLGAKVLGIEPGSHCLKAKDKYGVEIIHDFFPTTEIEADYDVIIMSLVLEHFQSPSVFLQSLHSYLKDDGQLIISVPDEEPFIQSGDISALFHEHYSFFTEATLGYALKAGKFRSVASRKGLHGGVLLNASVKDTSVKTSKAEVQIGLKLAKSYKIKAKKYNKKLLDFLLNIKSLDQSLGVYVPSRFMNILTICKVEGLKLRFFDDNPSITGKYYPGMNIAIETRKDLIKCPTDIILIFSKAFGQKIKQNVCRDLADHPNIITWEELFENE